MVKLKTLPNRYILLDSKNPIIQNQIIKLFKDNNIRIYSETSKFDKNYPYLIWEEGYLSQRRTNENLQNQYHIIKTKEEFLSLFFDLNVIHEL